MVSRATTVRECCIFDEEVHTLQATRSVGASQAVTLRNDASAASLLHSPSTEGVLTPSRQSSSSPSPLQYSKRCEWACDPVEARYGVGEDWYDATIVEVQDMEEMPLRHPCCIHHLQRVC